MWTDPVMQFIDVSTGRAGSSGSSRDMDDENVVPGPAMTVYHPFEQEIRRRSPVRARSRRSVHAGDAHHAHHPRLSADQPVERAATLDDVRAEVLAPDRLNALVFGVFAGVALLIAVVGVAGVLAFSVSARTREFGVRLAIGSEPRRLLTRVVSEGAVIAAVGIGAALIGGFALARFAGGWFADVRLPGLVPTLAAGALLVAAAVVASLMPAARASRINVVQALRAE